MWLGNLGRSRSERRVRLVPMVVAAVAGALALAAVSRGILDLPDWFEGGRSDPGPRGDVIYEGQEARSASEQFLVDIGDGEAVVSVRAKQNHDSSGWLIDGDFQSTNGTSSVADPDDRGTPAKLTVGIDYCADGLITTITPVDGDEAGEGDGGEGDGSAPVAAVRFEMGDLFVCDATLEHTEANDAAFQQDDTPNDLHGAFVSFVARAVETTAAASACPDDELAEFRSADYTAFVRSQLADRFGLAEDDVEVVAGRPGRSDEETRDELRARLDSFTSVSDPDDPSARYEALSFQYLAGDGEAVADACYRDPGGRDLDDLATVPAPDAGDEGGGSG
jgi:hypothetical protein